MKSSKRPRVIRRRRRLIACVCLLLVLGVLGAGWWRYSAKPAPWDKVGAYQAVETKLLDGRTRSEDDWMELKDLLAAEEQFTVNFSARYPDPDEVFMMAAYWGDESDSTNVPASLAMLEAYVASDLPGRITALRERQTLAPSLVKDDGIKYWVDPEAFRAVYALRFTESSRLRFALRARDHTMALESAQNLVWLATIPASQHSLPGLFHELLPWDALHDLLREEINAGRVDASIARDLLRLYLERDKSEPARTPLMLESDRIRAHATLDRIYAGDRSLELHCYEVSRVLWMSHRSAAREVDAVWEILDAYLKAGPRSSVPSHPVLDRGEIGPSLAPVYDVTWHPKQFDRSVFFDRQKRRLVMLGLAITVYRDTHGALPPTLDALVDVGLLPAVPEDPFAPDNAFRYTRDATALLGYRLYALGQNDQDDGGSALLTGSDPWRSFHGMYESDTLFSPLPEWPDEE